VLTVWIFHAGEAPKRAASTRNNHLQACAPYRPCGAHGEVT
jgi:hypothetical protein